MRWFDHNGIEGKEEVFRGGISENQRGGTWNDGKTKQGNSVGRFGHARVV